MEKPSVENINKEQTTLININKVNEESNKIGEFQEKMIKKKLPSQQYENNVGESEERETIEVQDQVKTDNSENSGTLPEKGTNHTS